MRVQRHPHRSRELWQLALEVTNVGLEAIILPHFDGEKVVVVLGFPARGVLSEEHFVYLLEVVERARRQRIEPI